MIAGVSVAQVMRAQVVAVREKARFTEIVSAMRRFRLSSLPVIDSEDHVIGLIRDDDVLRDDTGHDEAGGRLRRIFGPRPDGAGRLATELMSTPAVTVTGATPAREAARAMYRHRIHQLPVVDETTNRLVGMVTRSDLLAVYERPDDDIRREISRDVIERTLGMPADRFRVNVVGGTVTVHGRLARRSEALRVADAVTRVDGVITVIGHLTYEHDDLHTSLPNP